MRLALLSLPGNFHCRKWAGALARAGAKTTVYSFEASEIPGVECVRIKPPVIWKGRYRFPSYLLAARTLRRELESRRTGVLHPLHLTPFGVWARRSGFRPYIPAAVGADVFEYAQKDLRRGRWADDGAACSRMKDAALRPFYRREVAAVLRDAARVTADNQPLADAMRETFAVPEEKIELLRWGLDPELFDATTDAEAARTLRGLNIPEDSRLVLSPRGLKPVYQAEAVLQAFAELLADEANGGRQFVALTAGYDSAPGALANARKLAAQYPRFTLIKGQLSPGQMAALWKRTDVFISVPMYDGYSSAVAEGRYAGAVPVVNAIPGNLELLRDEWNALFVRPFNARNLAAVLRRALNEHERLRPVFAARNRAWILEHGLLDSAARRFLELAEGVLKG